MAIKHENIIRNHQFLFIHGNETDSFGKISNIASGIEFDEILEGGHNSGPRFLMKPKSTLETLVLEGIAQPLKSQKQTYPIGYEVISGTVLLVKGGETVKMYGFDHGVVKSFEISELNALNPGILSRKLTIAHSGLEELL